MKSFNLTEWALNHRATVLFVILAIMIGGVLGFKTLGQLEDPKFSVPSMTVMVMWPGATAQQMQDEVSTGWRRSSSNSITSTRS